MNTGLNQHTVLTEVDLHLSQRVLTTVLLQVFMNPHILMVVNIMFNLQFILMYSMFSI